MALESEHIEICLIHGFVLFPTDYSPNSATELRAGMRCKLAAWIALRTGQANDAIAFKATMPPLVLKLIGPAGVSSRQDCPRLRWQVQAERSSPEFALVTRSRSAVSQELHSAQEIDFQDALGQTPLMPGALARESTEHALSIGLPLWLEASTWWRYCLRPELTFPAGECFESKSPLAGPG